MTAPYSASADPRRRLMIMVGVGVALGALLVVGGRVLSGESEASDEDVATVGAPASPAPATPATAAPEVQVAAPVETFEVFATKNPFIALRTAAAPGTGSTSANPAAASAVPAVATAAPPAAAPFAAPVATTTAGSAGAATIATAGATTPPGGEAGEPTGSVIKVALLDVFAEGGRAVANIKVNDTVSKVGGGDSFASNFKVVSLDPAARCGRFLYGDDQFQLCKGEEILK